MSATMSSYVVDMMWQLTNCFNCFPSNPALKINGRSYKILRLLGEGGFSYVYLVQSPPSPNLHALKKIRCPFGAESVALALKEVEAYSLFHPHPNIIHALDHAVIPDRSDPSAKTVYILLPYYRRGNLQDAINANLVNGAKFPERKLMVLFRGVCEALQAMHNYKVGGAPGGKQAQSRAKRVRADAARADRGEDHGDDDHELGDAEPLMEGEITMEQEGMSDGQVRAYAHRDIKPGKIHRLPTCCEL
jgi:serine/threonine kinase 16